MNITPPPFKENWQFYLKYIGLGLICASVFYWLYFRN